MIFYQDSTLSIRSLEESDIPELVQAFLDQQWQKPAGLFEQYFLEQYTKSHHALVARFEGKAAGYTTYLPLACVGPFAGVQPEVVDLNVLKKYQQRGIGNALLDVCENLARTVAPAICLAVGLHAGYGQAQRIYARRGYIPDGSGVWYRDQPLEPYTACVNDDDLVLYLSKRLHGSPGDSNRV